MKEWLAKKLRNYSFRNEEMTSGKTKEWLATDSRNDSRRDEAIRGEMKKWLTKKWRNDSRRDEEMRSLQGSQGLVWKEGMERGSADENSGLEMWLQTWPPSSGDRSIKTSLFFLSLFILLSVIFWLLFYLFIFFSSSLVVSLHLSISLSPLLLSSLSLIIFLAFSIFSPPLSLFQKEKQRDREGVMWHTWIRW